MATNRLVGASNRKLRAFQGILERGGPVLLLVFLGVGVFPGCAVPRAERVSSRGYDRTASAPSNERENRGGVIRYTCQGRTEAVAANRSEAYRQMHEFCAGPYVIVSENLGSQSFGSVPVGGIFFNLNQEYVYLTYQCQ